MRRYWFGLLLLASICLPLPSKAGEVIAVTSPGALRRKPVIATRPAVELGQPRIVRGAAPSLSPLVPITNQARALTSFAAEAEPLTGSASIMRPQPQVLASTRGAFAVERVGFEPRTESQPLVQVSASSQLPVPGQSEVVVGDGPNEVVMLNEYPDQDLFTHPYNLYGSAEYLLWWTRNYSVPPLVTTTSNPNPQRQRRLQPPMDFGVIGAPTTVVLSDDEVDQGVQHGARLRLGYRLPTHKPLFVEGSYFFLAQKANRLFDVSEGAHVIDRPFLNGNQLFEDQQVVAGPFVGPGTIAVEAPSSLQGADLNLRCGFCCPDPCADGLSFDLFAGGRWLQLREGLYITEQGLRLANNQIFRLDDRFDTQNTFWGGQLGVTTSWKYSRLSVDLRTSVALGVSRQVVGIHGSAVLGNADGSVTVQPGALLTLPSNIGRFNKDRFAVVPEIGLNVGYQVTDWMKVFAGYNFLFWSSVVRPGDQIDRVLDITQIPGQFATPLGNGTFRAPNGAIIRPLSPPRPLPTLKDSAWWAQGMNVGLESALLINSYQPDRQ